MIPSIAQALPITLNSPGIVGAVDGALHGEGGTSPANEEILAERLLAMAINTTELVGLVPAIHCSAEYAPCEYRTGSNHYAAANLMHIDGEKKILARTTPSVDLLHQGNVYLMAKYNGQNAGHAVLPTGLEC